MKQDCVRVKETAYERESLLWEGVLAIEEHAELANDLFVLQLLYASLREFVLFVYKLIELFGRPLHLFNVCLFVECSLEGVAY
jgi:hypothetical protein